MAVIPRFDDNSLQAIANIIGDTSAGLTGSEIGRLLNRQGVEDIDPANTKKYRLYNALANQQNKDSCANNVIAFVQSVMDPIRYTGDHNEFESRRAELNMILSFRGYEIGVNGKVQIISRVDTLKEAEKRARGLRFNLEQRKIHADVLKFCRAELLQDNYFHAVFEATKSMADKIRDMSGLSTDGTALIDEAFSIKYPLLAMNKLTTENEKMVQTGFATLLKGIFGTFRNTTAHVPKIKWNIEEQDALDLLTMVSYAHRKLDKTIRTGFTPKILREH